MALPTSYLTSTKNTAAIFDAIAKAQAPQRFTQKFLEQLGFTATADRLMINVMKAVGLLTDTGVPTQQYHEFLDKSESGRVLAAGIRRAYADLFQINANAQEMSRQDVIGKMKTISQGAYSDGVLGKMASTFITLCKLADFTSVTSNDKRDAGSRDEVHQDEQDRVDGDARRERLRDGTSDRRLIDGLVYNINIHLPESRQPEVYDALFRALREHLL